MYAKQNELTLEVHSIESDIVDGKYGKYMAPLITFRIITQYHRAY